MTKLLEGEINSLSLHLKYIQNSINELTINNEQERHMRVCIIGLSTIVEKLIDVAKE